MTAFQLGLLQGLANGLSARELATRHLTSEDAVRHHLAHLYEHLGARNQAEAVAIAFRRGLIS